jgi:hypothetical protein
MELWQMDIVGGVKIVDGSEAKIVSGVDDHSRFCISAQVVARATARPTCDALGLAMSRFGVPKQILTDNGKVFTGRFGPRTGEVLFDRICRENGIKHILTRPRSPTTTGKVERWHKTLRMEFLTGKVFDSIADAQAQFDGWVREYNRERPHQSLGMKTPWDRFQLAKHEPAAPQPVESSQDPAGAMPPSASRRVDTKGTISFAATRYKAGVWLAGQDVQVVCDSGLVQIHHRGVLIATHAGRHEPGKQQAGMQRQTGGREPTRRPTVSVVTVSRKVDSSGNISFAGTNYRVGSAYRRRQVQVAVVGDHVRSRSASS